MSKRFYCNPHFRKIIAMLDHGGAAMMICKGISKADVRKMIIEEGKFLDKDERECMRTYVDEEGT